MDLGDTSRTTNEDNFVNLLLINLGIFEDTFDGFNSTVESNRVDFFELGTSNVGLEINTFEKRINFDSGLSQRR